MASGGLFYGELPVMSARQTGCWGLALSEGLDTFGFMCCWCFRGDRRPLEFTLYEDKGGGPFGFGGRCNL